MREADPKETRRAEAFNLWMQAPMPMVTLFWTMDVTRLIRYSRRHGCKCNMLLCWCIGKAAAGMEAFYLLPVGGKLLAYDRIAINTVVATGNGGIATCDIPFSPDLQQFQQDYLQYTRQVQETGQAHDLGPDYMVIGTSALVPYPVDGAVNIYAGIYNNPFLIWGGWRRQWRKTRLKLSFQFHHTQMDGRDAAQFLERLQQEIDALK